MQGSVLRGSNALPRRHKNRRASGAVREEVMSFDELKLDEVMDERRLTPGDSCYQPRPGLGRPGKPYKPSLERDLTPQERKIVHLRCAGMSMGAVALQLGTYEQNVRNILSRPHVLRYMAKLEAELCVELAPVARALSEEMEAVSGEAFDRLVDNMRSLDEIGERACASDDLKNGIRAKLGAVASAQDILDRAGKRAPTKTIGAMMHVVAPEQLEKLERIMGDVIGRDESATNGK